MTINDELTKINRELQEFEDARQSAAKRGNWKDVKRLRKCIGWNKELLKNNS